MVCLRDRDDRCTGTHSYLCRGAIGPKRLFSKGSQYWPQTFAAIGGAVLPIPLWWLGRRYPKRWFSQIDLVVMFNGVLGIPPATGVNYASCLLVGFIFREWAVHRSHDQFFTVLTSSTLHRLQSTLFATGTLAGGQRYVSLRVSARYLSMNNKFAVSVHLRTRCRPGSWDTPDVHCHLPWYGSHKYSS